MKLPLSIILGTALVATAAQAQDRPAAQTAPATSGQRTANPAPSPTPAPNAAATPAPAATPAAQPAPATSASVTDAEVTQFAAAALAVEKIRKDTSVPDADKNARFVEAIQAVGIDPVRFNAIGQGMQADPALNTRVQKAAAAAQQASAPAASTAQ